jgi:hypothetical protein
MTSEINEYLGDKENIEISYHNIITNGQGYVIATVKTVAEKAKDNTKEEDSPQSQT